MKVVRHWNRLPREVVGATSLGTFRVRLDGALSNLVWLQMSLLTAERLDWTASKGPCQRKAFYESMTLCKALKQPAQAGQLKSSSSAKETFPESYQI